MCRLPAEFRLEYLVSGRISGIFRIPDIRYSVFSFYRISGIRLSGKFAIRHIPTIFPQVWLYQFMLDEAMLFCFVVFFSISNCFLLLYVCVLLKYWVVVVAGLFCCCTNCCCCSYCCCCCSGPS